VKFEDTFPPERGPLADGVRQLPLAEAPEQVWAAIESALDGGSATPPRRSRGRLWKWTASAAAAAIAIVIWIAVRPPKAHWAVERVDGSPSIGRSHLSGTGSLSVGEWLETDGSSRARIQADNLGTVEVEPNTRLKLAVSRPNEHRLTLDHGEISAVVSAPPRLFFVDTSSSTAVDLGCAYKMNVDEAGFGLLRVTLGWVSLEWGGRESKVPAGAACRTRPKVGPGTPYFEDAPPRLEQALDAFDFEQGGSAALDAILEQARVRDTLTLWHLLARVRESDRARIFDRMEALAGLPDGVTREKILALDPAALEAWNKDLAWKW
jgi:hypothetical protein